MRERVDRGKGARVEGYPKTGDEAEDGTGEVEEEKGGEGIAANITG